VAAEAADLAAMAAAEDLAAAADINIY